MSRRTVGVAVGLVVLVVGGIVYFTRPAPDPVVEPDPHPLGGATADLAIAEIEYPMPNGRQKVKPDRNGFTVFPGRGPVVVTGVTTAGAGSLTARLADFDPIEREEVWASELPVVATSATGFRVEVPSARLELGHVYRIALTDASSGRTATYQFNVPNYMP